MSGVRLVDDLLIEIFVRLPVKSTLRFRCISKSWLRLLSEPAVVKRLRPTISGFFHTGEHGRARYAPLHYPYKDQHKFDVEKAFSNLTLEDSCNGLLLFDGTHTDKAWEAVVANPATNTRITMHLDIPFPSSREIEIFMKLAYYPLVSPHRFAIVVGIGGFDYDVRKAGYYCLRIFYGATADHKLFDLPELRFTLPRRIYPCRVINGSLYLGRNSWEAMKVRIITGSGTGEQPLGRDEEPIYWPRPIDNGFVELERLREGGELFGEFQGNYHFASTHRSRLLVWIRKGSSWERKHSTNIQPLIVHHMKANPHLRRFHCDVYPQAFHPDLDVIFLQVDKKMYAWHVGSNKFEEVCSNLPCHGRYHIYPYMQCSADVSLACRKQQLLSSLLDLSLLAHVRLASRYQWLN